MPLARNIDEVLSLLDAEVRQTMRDGDAHGIFAALYLKMSVRVWQGIQDGVFDDGVRMDRFDTLFANRYFVARDAWRAQQDTTKSWRVAFQGAREDDNIALQHMLLGVNAHINLDLPIAAAETVPTEEIADLEDDFERINDIIAELLDDAQEVLGKHSPGMRMVDLLGGPLDEWFGVFSIKKMRQRAWAGALALSRSPDAPHRDREIVLLDRQVALLGRLLTRPPRPLQTVVDLVRAGEGRDPTPVIAGLYNI